MKRALMILIVGLGASALRADYTINWQVADANYTFDYAKVALVAGDSTDYLRLAATDDILTADAVEGGMSTEVIKGARLPSDYSSWAENNLSLFIELHTETDGDELIAVSDTLKLSEIRSQFGAVQGGITEPGVGVWTVSTFNAVPEPTSGLLLLLGFASLALRRRQA